mmetsp:Transcript_26502/g.56792  ORF Transcript_26502/g.56792 Transcript_26502/m.56792 type:complete len:458 (+) Transcript_26502:232-1605(+)|eukprot:CAMPEP_0201123794 /NCGR_PEP_ID=MMETSP0850-20130426/9092_1 /ASSEMBLY_ACC=CAM_ASM_000622 /TAXON_ID=183588 /ORGANISM="Pseudo-nitzschia fraudulenta, Strain WWA7" /LENGTH=457 /DNA_ID=CAMNT_0047390871 /DNA_START=156 /DNA_END=1529 /DNA_ORIENTATION=+
METFRRMPRSGLAGALALAIAISVAASIGGSGAFSPAFPSTNKNQHLVAASRSLSSSNGGDFGELTSALAKLDQQWQIEQRSSFAEGRGKPRWSKLVLPKEEGGGGGGTNEATETPFRAEDDYVWMLEPPRGSIPSCVVVFTGGAGLGQFPQVAYNELLSGISDKLNAVCLTVPYEVGLDHFALAKQTGEKIRRALLVLKEDDESNNEQQQRSLPTYSLAHSLGCKLQTIYLAATGLEVSFDGVGFLAYNNFSFARTISMARIFAKELTGGGMPGGTGSVMGNINPEVVNNLFDFAEMAVGAIGVEFSPTPEDTERLIQLRYNDGLKDKTRVFVFDSDNLDSSEDFRRACGGSSDVNGSSVDVSSLEGGHLTPVYIQFQTDEIAREAMGGLGDTFSQENLDAAKEAMGGFQGASFGDEIAFGALVDEVCDWILGKPPSIKSRKTNRVLPIESSSSNN